MSQKANGCLLTVLGLICLGILINIGRLTWPVCAAAVVAAGLWLITARYQSAPMRAATAVSGSVAIGLGLLSLLLLIFNLNSPSQELDAIRISERILVYLDNRLPKWTDLSIAQFTLILLALLVASWLFPDRRLLARYSWTSGFLHRAALVLAGASAFTFFTNVAIIHPKGPRTYLRIDALLRKSADAERKSIEHFLSARALIQYLQQPGSVGATGIIALAGAILNVPEMDLSGKVRLADYTAHLAMGAPEIVQRAPRTRVAPELAVATLDLQTEKELIAAQHAEEAIEAAHLVLEKASDIASDPVKKIVWALVEGLINAQGIALPPLTDIYMDEVIDNYSERIAEPIAENIGARFNKMFGGHQSVGVTAQRTVAAAIPIMAERETGAAMLFSASAQRAATNASAAARDDDEERLEKALAEAQKESSRAIKAAEFAQSASRAAGEIGRDVRNASIAGGVVAGALDAAELATAAKAAAEATEAARAAKAAVDAAEATKTLAAAADVLRAIPK